MDVLALSILSEQAQKSQQTQVSDHEFTLIQNLWLWLEKHHPRILLPKVNYCVSLSATTVEWLMKA